MFFWVPVKVNRYENRSGYGPCLNPKMPDFLNDNGHESFLKKYVTANLAVNGFFISNPL